MVLLRFVVLLVLVVIVSATPTSYQYINFIRNGRAKADASARASRSFSFESKGGHSEHFWSNDDDLHVHRNALTFEEHRGHFTPDFSNGLDYPDPLLLTGFAAKRAASYLYRKPLFFGEINHIEALERNQEDRRRSGLAGNKLGSLRTHLPFYRFKKTFYPGFF